MDLIYLSPCIALDGDVAEHVWSRKDVSYKHLKVLGCRAFAHVLDVERPKLDGKAKECVCLGYAHYDFGYKLWDLVKKGIF